MTEADWLACTDPTTMLAFHRGLVADRQLRLYACACVRLVQHTSSEQVNPKELHAVEVTERFLDGLATDTEQLLFHQEVYDQYVNAYIAIDSRAGRVAGVAGWMGGT